jgi:hypothetical protein
MSYATSGPSFCFLAPSRLDSVLLLERNQLASSNLVARIDHLVSATSASKYAHRDFN